MIVLDTTVLVYVVGVEHPMRAPCRQLIRAIEDGALQATTTVEVIQEFAHVRARRRGRADAARLSRDYAELLAPLITVTHEDLQAGLALFERNERLGPFDAVLIAASAARNATALVSADSAFADVGEVAHVVPNARGVRALLEV